MGINKYNCEGYYDPTPYEALTRIENEARKLHSFRPVVYICSPLSGDVEGNQEKAARYPRSRLCLNSIHKIRQFMQPC